MTTEQYIRAIAGTFVLLSLALGYLVSPYWHLFTVFVGLNLVQSAFTGWCLMEKFLTRLGIGCRNSRANELVVAGGPVTEPLARGSY